MDIGRTEGVGGPGRIGEPPRPSSVNPPPANSPPRADRVEISTAAHLLCEALALPPTRAERIEETRRLIAEGRFDTEERLEGALNRFLRENPDLLP